MDNMIISEICSTIGSEILVKLKEDNEFHKIKFGFTDNIDYSCKNIGIEVSIGNGKGRKNILFSKDSNKDEFEYILEKMINYDFVNRFVKNLIYDYFRSQGIEVITSKENKD